MTITPTSLDSQEVESFAGRLFEAAIHAIELIDIALGARLGCYAELAASPLNAAELANRCGIAERYAREWLEQQAVAGILGVDDPEAPADERRYSLSPAHAHVLLEQDSEAYMVPLVEAVVAGATWVPMLAEAYRAGRGISFADFGVQDIQAAFSRPAFRNHLVQTWLPALPDMYAKLEAGTARIAEIGCGEGVAAVTIAEAFPGVRVDAFDLDDVSIARARRNAADAGVTDRVRFEVSDASALRTDNRYDLVFCVEMLHDVSDPVGVLTSMRAARAPGGAVLVVDERVAERFTAPGDLLERLLYGFSTLHCLPAGMAQQPSAATGTVMRPATVRRYAEAAGFASVTLLPVEHPQLALYRLDG